MIRSITAAGLAALLAVTLAPAAVGGSDVERVVVTGSRLYSDNIPHISLLKRADYMITKVRVTCDTRDEKQRRSELKASLRDMLAAAAKSGTISLALGESVLGPLRESMFDDIITDDKRDRDKRDDTDGATVVIKTKLTSADTFESATGRIKAFIEKAPKAGRTEILREEGWDLSIVDPEQYRDDLIKQIVADAKHTAELVGSSHSASIEGLQSPVAWYQQGPLDLGLYISYTMTLVPTGAAK